ncbi:MAG: acyl carrier protein [Acetobacteraceae bacterium]|nr:acyl carrier protein [Acetobacteraceae bacterium]MBV8522848.1 acyl carrier protein [Acetobacteraceae bacterium]
MSEAKSPLEHQLARLIVDTLNLEISPEEIVPDAPLFRQGLGLDSIDALELSLALSRRYGFELKSDDQRNRQIFASLRNLAAHISANRIK